LLPVTATTGDSTHLIDRRRLVFCARNRGRHLRLYIGLWLRKVAPRAAMLGTLAGVALT
jgi:hypothetical protein